MADVARITPEVRTVKVPAPLRDLPSPAELAEAFLYDSETGRVFWRTRPRSHFANNQVYVAWNNKFAGREAGWLDSSGYRGVCYRGKTYNLHRVVWAIYYGVWPSGEVDHANTDKLDNRIGNLRDATHSQNQANGRPYRTNKSGFKGVYLRKSGKWSAQIRHNKILYSLGLYATAELAAEAYTAAAEKLFGAFARGGSV